MDKIKLGKGLVVEGAKSANKKMTFEECKDLTYSTSNQRK
jgi:hypothetical protein